jgi:hypothetical protein
VKIEEFRHRKVPAFGECVYCGVSALEAPLTDEHIVPLSLGGTNVLQEASCASCAVLTSKLELHLARVIFGHHRVHANVATRRPKKRPTVLPTRLQVGEDPAQDLELPIADHPYFTLLPVWNEPGILTGKIPSSDFGTEEFHRFEFVPKHFRELLSLAEADVLNFELPIKLDQDQFSRALAKIAYCEALARYGLDGFERTTIVEFILGRYPFAQYLVGGTAATVAPPMPKNIDHAIALFELLIGSRNFVIAAVRLFSNTGTPTHGMPWYTVVLGARLDQTLPTAA